MEIKLEYYKKYRKLPGHKFDDFVPNNLYDGFKVPNSEILNWLKERGKNLKLTTEWDDMEADAHDKAFTVAKVMTADILQTIFDSVLKAKAEGWTLKQFQDNLLPELEEKGWAGATPHRLKVIYDTNMRMAQAKGKYRKQKSVSAIYPFWVYKQIERKNKRHDHSKWDNKKFRHDDPIWVTIYPPSAFGCGCTVTPVKDGTGVENGEDFLDELASSDEYKLSPLKAWKPDTSKYVSELKSKLEQILNKNSIPQLAAKLLKDNDIQFDVNLKKGDIVIDELLNNIVKKLLQNKDISNISKLIIDFDSEYDTGFETYTTNMVIGYRLITEPTELGKYRKLMSKQANPDVNNLSDDDFIDYTLKHELTHIRYNRLTTKLKERKFELDYELNQIFADYTKDYDPYEFDPQNPGNIFSKYSTRNKDEMVAEAFALFRKGLVKDNKYINKIISVFDKYESGLEQ